MSRWQTPLPVPTVDPKDKRFQASGFWRGDAFVAFIAFPQLLWAGKFMQQEFTLNAATGSGAVMLVEAVTIAAENRGTSRISKEVAHCAA